MNEMQLEQSIFADMANLESVLKEDITGDRARTMVAYFQTIVDATQRMQATGRDESQRYLVGQLLGGFKAADRIIRRVWETMHGTMLVI